MDNFQVAVEICQSIIGRKTNVTDEEINNAIRQVKKICANVETEKLKNDLLSMYSIQIDTFQILEGKERREPWLKDFKANKKSDSGCATHHIWKSKRNLPQVLLCN